MKWILGFFCMVVMVISEFLNGFRGYLRRFYNRVVNRVRFYVYMRRLNRV